MLHLARFSIRRPLLALLAWVAAAAVLAAIGLGVSDSLAPSKVVVPGTESSRAEHLARAEFGPSILVPILLEGPKAQLDDQGPDLALALAGRPDTRVISAWSVGDTGKELRPSATQAMIVAAVARTEEEMVETVQAEIERTVDGVVAAPVDASVTGQPSIDIGMRDAALDAAMRGELIAVPSLFVVLLVLLRAPVAAAALAAFGGVTALSGFGLMAVLGRFLDVDATAVALGSLVGLALGVGFGMIILRRHEEELAKTPGSHEDAIHAASVAVRSTGRAVLLGGTALVISLLVATAVAPTEILSSLGIGVLLCSMLGVGAAVVVMPAVAVLLGHRLMAGFHAPPGPVGRAWRAIVGGGSGFVLRRAVIAGAIATAALVALAIPVLRMETGPPSAALLPEGAEARQSFEAVAGAMGPGWPTPYNIVIVSKEKPITDRAILAKIDDLQLDIASDDRVASVIGPGAIYSTSDELKKLPEALGDSADMLEGGKEQLTELASGLGKAGAGVRRLRSGLESASSGAGQLQSGSGTAQSGAGQLKTGLDKARTGAAAISGGLTQALDAAGRLRDGAAQALAGTNKLVAGTGQAATTVRDALPFIDSLSGNVSAGVGAVSAARGEVQNIAGALNTAAAQLQALDGSDPAVQAARSAIEQAMATTSGASGSLAAAEQPLSSAAGVAAAFAGQLPKLSAGLAQLNTGTSDLADGLAALKDGNAQLATGIDKLASGGGQLTGGIDQLRNGAAQLETGLGTLTGGAGQLASALQSGTGPTGELVSGLGLAEGKVPKFSRALPSPEDLQELQRESPKLFDSGYFVLAAVAGATYDQRSVAGFAVNVERGGTAGQITIVSKTPADSDATQDLGERLRILSDEFAQDTRTEVAVGGPAGALVDFETETLSRLWPAIIAVAGAVALMLMVALRAVLLPIAAVLLDLLTIAAGFGAMSLLFVGEDPVLGGPGYIDPMSIIGLFAMVFGLTIVYEMVLMHRARERYVAGEGTEESLRSGLRDTAAAATGAAAVMVAAAIPFMFEQLVTVRQFGVGVAVVVIIDALIVRPVLLPAAMEVLGRRGWWPTRPAAPAPPWPPEEGEPPVNGRLIRLPADLPAEPVGL